MVMITVKIKGLIFVLNINAKLIILALLHFNARVPAITKGR